MASSGGPERYHFSDLYRWPALIVRCAGTADVINAVNLARSR
jgi:hypothetical protein